MRIRKNAKTSAAFLHTNSNFNLHPSDNNNHHTTSLCLLNQSPWDIITFPSTHSSSDSTSILLFDDFVTRYNVNVAANWSSPDSTRPFQSVSASTKNSFESEHDCVNGNGNVDEKIKNYESCRKDDKLGFMKGCVKKDHNLVVLQNDAVWSTKKKAQSVLKSRGTKKRTVGIISKQDEFYYYSGFGPSWGKKRGCTTFNACGTVVTASSDDCDMDLEVEEDRIRAEPDTAMVETVWSCQAVPVQEYFDHVEQDEQVDDKQKEKTVKKRGRKPMKARSLKSLM